MLKRRRFQEDDRFREYDDSGKTTAIPRKRRFQENDGKRENDFERTSITGKQPDNNKTIPSGLSKGTISARGRFHEKNDHHKWNRKKLRRRLK